MKRIIIVFLALFLVVPLVAQEGSEESNRRMKLSFEVGIGSDLFYKLSEGHYLSIGTKLSTIASYELNPYLSLGAGAGIYPIMVGEYAFWPGDDISRKPIYTLLPVFFDINYFVLDRKTSPYISCKLGYSMNLKRSWEFTEEDYQHYPVGYELYLKYHGGVMVNPILGLMFKVPNSRISINMGIGYEIQHIAIKSYLGDYEYNLNSINLNLGISF